MGALQGKLDGVPFHAVGMKEEDYVMTLMSQYGTLTRMGGDKRRTIGHEHRHMTFKYTEVVHNHYQNRDSVEPNNARR